MFSGNGNVFGFIVALALIACLIYLLVRKDKYKDGVVLSK